MVTRRWKLSWILLLNILHTNVEAGLTKRSGRMAREVYPEIEPENDGNQGKTNPPTTPFKAVPPSVCIVGDVVYGIDELVPAEQPCLKCRCQPPGVQCETIKCVKKSGCKAIHRPNKCCPDYQCECHHEGKIYANGERLKTPTVGACKVCYCRGGEVQCAEVSCYRRTDCEGKTVPGQCCPKYDHCPPKEPLFGRPLIKQNSSEDTSSNKIEGVTMDPIKITRVTQTDFTDDVIKQIEEPKITIQEIIPEIKEIPAPSRSGEELKDDNDLVITDSEPDSSEISEVFQQPPPVLRIGDKLLFLKQGELVPEKDASTPTSVITIIGAEGLQRGFEDSAEFHETEHSLFNNSNDLEPKTSESTHILSLVKHKKKLTETTTNFSESEDDSSQPPSDEDIADQTELPVTDSPTKLNYDILIEENPAYPAIPEVMGPDLDDNNDTQLITNVKRTLPATEIEKNETLSEEMTTTEMEVNVTEETITSTEFERSMESIEEATNDSGENTTPNNDHASIISDENASVEPSESNFESADMLKEMTPTPNLNDDVEMITNKTEDRENLDKDMEMINFTHVDHDIKSEKLQLPVKSLDKRENSDQDEADEIFRELEAELNVDSTERTQTVEEEKEESEKIFQELLEETSTPRSAKKLDKNEESIHKVTDAIAKLTLKGRKNSFDANILGVISNFFGSQYRYDRRK